MEYTYKDNFIDLDSLNSIKLEECKEKVKIVFNNWKTTTSSSKDYKLLHRIHLNEFDDLTNLADSIINNFKQVIIIGIGGSILNPKMASFCGKTAVSSIPIKYLDTTDPFYYQKIINSVDLNDTYFLVISKSGQTIEILSILGAVLHEFEQQKILDYGKNFCFITGKEDSPIKKIATNMDAPILQHDNNVGGRFSTFTNVGILPGLLAGLDMKAFIDGANSVVDSFWQQKENSLPSLAAISLFLFNKPLLINIGYLKGFSYYLDWYTQIISESLGKDGKGFTPITNLGPMDQHSMFQLHLEGPQDKVFTFISNGGTISNNQQVIGFIPELELANLAGKTLNEINDIEYSATIDCCKAEKFPAREIILKKLDERSFGALAIHSILEVILLGNLMQINPFGQPSVEKIKVKIKALLAKDAV